jgi:hypothetical protein
MRLKAAVIFALVLAASATVALAQTPKLDGAYKFVSVKFPGGAQTEAQAKGMIVVHGKYMAFVQSGVDRKTWTQEEPEADRTKKIVEAFNGLRATAGSFEIQGNTIVINQIAQANPGSMGKPSKWEFRLEGNNLVLKPAGVANVEFTFERMP